MNKEELLKDLRNKLTPMWNYLAILRDIDVLSSNDNKGSDFGTFSDRISDLKIIAGREQLMAEKSMHQVEYIIEQLEKL